MFQEHISEFDEVAKRGCIVLASSKKERVNLNESDDFLNEQEHKSFVKLVNSISSDIDSQANLINGQCNIVLQFFVFGFAGTGLTYNFYYNIVPGDSELVNDQNLYKVMTGNKYKVHFPLKNDWYLYIQRS